MSRVPGLLFGKDAKVLLRSVEYVIDHFGDEFLNFVEVGVALGDTSGYLIEQIRERNPKSGFHYYAVDSPSIEHAPEVDLPEFEFVEGLSCSPEVLNRLPKRIHWAFIDACHCAICVQRDGIVYASKLVKDGVICFHDATPHPEWQGSIQAIHPLLDPYHDTKRAERIHARAGIDSIPKDVLGLTLQEPVIYQPSGGVEVYRKG
jgi:hypothetical protein